MVGVVELSEEGGLMSWLGCKVARGWFERAMKGGCETRMERG